MVDGIKSKKISFIILNLIVQIFLVVLITLIIYLDAVIFGHGASEFSFTQFSQEGLLFVSAVIFFALSKNQPESRGFLVLCGGFFTVLLIRELDVLFDQIRHGLWIYPAIVAILVTLIYARKRPETVSGPLVYYLQTYPFAYITIGLMIVVVFSRIFGSGIIWKVVMANEYSFKLKSIVQEGVELLGYAFIFYGSVLLWIRRTILFVKNK
jgi:hypothetical protein